MEKSKSTKKVIVKNKGVVKKSNNASKKKKVLNNLLEDKKYKLAEKYYKNKDFENAYKEYLNLCDIYPKNKKIYWACSYSSSKYFNRACHSCMQSSSNRTRRNFICYSYF